MPGESSLCVNAELTAEDIARVFESSLLTMPVLQKVRLMNRLLHDHPQVFHAL